MKSKLRNTAEQILWAGIIAGWTLVILLTLVLATGCSGNVPPKAIRALDDKYGWYNQTYEIVSIERGDKRVAGGIDEVWCVVAEFQHNEAKLSVYDGHDNWFLVRERRQWSAITGLEREFRRAGCGNYRPRENVSVAWRN